MTEPAHHLNHHVPGTELQSDSVRSLWSSAPVMYCNVIKVTNRDKNESTKRIRKGKKKQQLHELHASLMQFTAVDHVLKVLCRNATCHSCHRPASHHICCPRLLIAWKVDTWDMSQRFTESQDTDCTHCTQTHYIVIVHCAHCISLYSLCKPTLPHVTIKSWSTCRYMPSTSSLAECLVNMALGCSGMPWRHGRLWWCLSRPGSRGGAQRDRRQPKAPRIVQNVGEKLASS